MGRTRPKAGTKAGSVGGARKKTYALTYQVPSLIAQLAFKLTEPRRHVTVDEIMEEFRLQRRRVQRHLAGLRVGVFNGVFHSAVLRLEDRFGSEIPVGDEEVAAIPVTRIARVRLTASSGDELPETPAEDLVPVYLAFTVLRYLEGIVPREEVSKLWRELAARLAPAEAVAIGGFDRKFFPVPFTPKDYTQHREAVSAVIDALLRQHVLEIDYYGLKGEGQHHRFEPCTLAMYRGGLYLLGQSDRREGITTLAVERIDRLDKARDASGNPARFTYPADYSPQEHFQGAFGIIVEAPESEVEIEIQNPETEARLRERTIHPSQRFEKRKDAPAGRDGYRKVIMRMKVRGTTELAYWILQQGPYVKVLRPESLRREVERLLSESLGLYRG